MSIAFFSRIQASNSANKLRCRFFAQDWTQLFISESVFKFDSIFVSKLLLLFTFELVSYLLPEFEFKILFLIFDLSKKSEKNIEFGKKFVSEISNSNWNKIWINIWKGIFKINSEKVIGKETWNSSLNKKNI